MNSRFLSFAGWDWMWDGTFFEQVFFCLRLLVSLVVIVNIFIVSLFLPDITQINLMTRRYEMCVSNDPELIVESCTVWMGSFESSIQEWTNKGTCCFVLRPFLLFSDSLLSGIIKSSHIVSKQESIEDWKPWYIRKHDDHGLPWIDKQTCQCGQYTQKLIDQWSIPSGFVGCLFQTIRRGRPDRMPISNLARE